MSFVHTREDPFELINFLVEPRNPRRREKLRAMFQRQERVQVFPPKLQPKPASRIIDVSDQSRKARKAYWQRWRVERKLYNAPRVISDYQTITHHPVFKYSYNFCVPTVDQVKEVTPRKRLFDIISEVALKHNIRIEDIKSARRTRSCVKPRQEFFYRARMETLKSLPEIAKYCGNRDHTTALHGVRKYAKDHGLPIPGVDV